MSKYDKFLGIPVETEVLGEKIKIVPLKAEDIGKISRLSDAKTSDEEKSAITIGLVFEILTYNDPTLSRQDFDKLSIGFINAVVEKMIEVNGLEK